MAIIERGNWSFRDPGDDIPDGSTINGGNFCNVVKDPAWTINSGSFGVKSFCAHLHPEWVAIGALAAEVENCPHVVEVIQIVNGDDVYIYADGVV